MGSAVKLGLADGPAVVTARNPKALPGSIAATKLFPKGLTEAEKPPLVLGVVTFPPKLRTIKVVGSRPAGTVRLPFTVEGGTIMNEKVKGFPRGLSAAFRTWLPIVTLYVPLGVSAPEGVRVTIIPVESELMVTGKEAREFARVNVLGPIVAESNGSLNVI
jgi:hypothetical protein